jgi:hypothetical protein
MVKLLNAFKHRHRETAKEADRLSQKACSRVRAVQRGPAHTQETAGVAERTSPLLYPMQNMETLKSRATPVVATSTARQGRGLSIEKAEEANASV